MTANAKNEKASGQAGLIDNQTIFFGLQQSAAAIGVKYNPQGLPEQLTPLKRWSVACVYANPDSPGDYLKPPAQAAIKDLPKKLTLGRDVTKGEKLATFEKAAAVCAELQRRYPAIALVGSDEAAPCAFLPVFNHCPEFVFIDADWHRTYTADAQRLAAEQQRELAAECAGYYVEWSCSGNGLHIIAARGVRNPQGRHVNELYPDTRVRAGEGYILLTGVCLTESGSASKPADDLCDHYRTTALARLDDIDFHEDERHSDEDVLRAALTPEGRDIWLKGREFHRGIKSDIGTTASDYSDIVTVLTMDVVKHSRNVDQINRLVAEAAIWSYDDYLLTHPGTSPKDFENRRRRLGQQVFKRLRDTGQGKFVDLSGLQQQAQELQEKQRAKNLDLSGVNTEYSNVTGRKRRKHIIGGYAHRHSCVIASPGGEGKTTLACSWALILARVTGKWGNSDVDHGSVLYMAYEDGSGVKDLLRAQAHLFFGQQAEEVLANIRIVNAEEDSDVPPVNTADGVKFIIEQVKELEAETGRECVAVFIDTLTKSAFNLDVNSNKDADQYENHLKTIRQKTGATSIVLAHTNKSDKGSLLGATNWRNHAASVLILNAEPGSTILRVFIDKMKNGKSKYYFYVDAPIFHTPPHIAAQIKAENSEETAEPEDVDEFSCVNPAYAAPINDGSTVRCVVHLVSHNSHELSSRALWQQSPFLRRLRESLDGNARPLDSEPGEPQPQQATGTTPPATAAATIGEALTQVLCGMGSGSYTAAQIKAAFNNWMQATGQQFNSVNNDRSVLGKELTKLKDSKIPGLSIGKDGEGRNMRYVIKVKSHKGTAPGMSLNFTPSP
ncbi:AAA family ATPase [Salmonella enterica]|nr:AAA family ATPase [Salmonella enterica]